MKFGVAAVCCAQSSEGEWRGGYAGDDGEFPALPSIVEEAVALAARVGDTELDAALTPGLAPVAAGAKSVVVATAQHENAGSVVLVVLRDGDAGAGAKNRVETLAAFAQSAALIVSK